MDSAFASTMLSEVENLEKEINNFVSNTIVDGVWEGDAANNAKSQKEEHIDTKIEKIKEYLKNLIEAIDLAKQAVEKQEELDSVNNELQERIIYNNNVIDPKARISCDDLESRRTSLTTEIDSLKTNIESLCTS